MHEVYHEKEIRPAPLGHPAYFPGRHTGMRDSATVFLRQPHPRNHASNCHGHHAPGTYSQKPPTSSIPTLEAATLERLQINTGQTLQLQPGESYQLKLGTTECCYVFVDVPVEAAWWVSPQKGVKLDPASGLLEVSPEVEHGTAYTITANVENSRKVLTTPLLIYTPEGNPLAAPGTRRGFSHAGAVRKQSGKMPCLNWCWMRTARSKPPGTPLRSTTTTGVNTPATWPAVV